MRGHLDYESALGGMRVRLDHESALRSWQCTWIMVMHLIGQCWCAIQLGTKGSIAASSEVKAGYLMPNWFGCSNMGSENFHVRQLQQYVALSRIKTYNLNRTGIYPSLHILSPGNFIAVTFEEKMSW